MKTRKQIAKELNISVVQLQVRIRKYGEERAIEMGPNLNEARKTKELYNGREYTYGELARLPECPVSRAVIRDRRKLPRKKKQWSIEDAVRTPLYAPMGRY